MNETDGTSPGFAEPAPSPADTGLEALAWAVSAGTADEVVNRIRMRQRRRQRRRAITLAGSAVALFMVAAIWRANSASSESTAPTSPGSAIVLAPAMQILPDGSVVELKNGAAIGVDFSGPLRRVMLESGEAHFQVAKNPLRPFVVTAAGVEVRAVGTAFSVQLGASAVDVFVTEGRVAVEQSRPEPTVAPVASAGPAPLAMVDAGKRVVVETAPQAVALPPPVLVVSAAEQNERLAWRVPRLEFSGTPLSEAILMFNRYGRMKFVLDPALGQLQMSGVLRADDTGALLLLLKNEFRIEPDQRGSDALFLRRR